MPATLTDIYDFETALELGFKTALFLDEGINARITRSKGLNPKSSVMVAVGINGATGSHHFLASDGMEIDDCYTANLELGIQTLRQTGVDETAETSEHKALKIALRAWMIRGWIGVSDALPYHQIDRPPVPGATELDFEEDEYDVTMLIYSIKFSIRPDAWPLDV